MTKVIIKDVVTANLVNESTSGMFKVSIVVKNEDKKYLDEENSDGTACGYLLADSTLTKDKDNSELNYTLISSSDVPFSAGSINVSADIIASLVSVGLILTDDETNQINIGDKVLYVGFSGCIDTAYVVGLTKCRVKIAKYKDEKTDIIFKAIDKVILVKDVCRDYCKESNS